MTQSQINELVNNFKNWDINNAQVSLWSFRKRKIGGQVSYTTKWIDTDDSISSTLIDLFVVYQSSIEEAVPYSILGEVSANQFQHIESSSTIASLLTSQVDRIKENFQADAISDLDNSNGYVLRIEKDGQIAYSVKKTEESWKSKKAGGYINGFFQGTELTLLEDRTFKLAKKFDFIIFNDSILIENKKIFESLLDYNDDFKDSFTNMIQNPVFTGLFTDVVEINNYVGTNSLQLRRMHVIQQKGLYSDPSFIQRLIEKNRSDNWGIDIDGNGKITPTPDTVKTIITILLNHRLKSELSLETFDVPSSTQI